jgi:hypothetical protein
MLIRAERRRRTMADTEDTSTDGNAVNIMELLVALDDRLRQIGAIRGEDTAGWQAVFDEVAAGPRSPYVAPNHPDGIDPAVLLEIQLDMNGRTMLGLAERLLDMRKAQVARGEIPGPPGGVWRFGRAEVRAWGWPVDEQGNRLYPPRTPDGPWTTEPPKGEGEGEDTGEGE